MALIDNAPYTLRLGSNPPPHSQWRLEAYVDLEEADAVCLVASSTVAEDAHCYHIGRVDDDTLVVSIESSFATRAGALNRLGGIVIGWARYS